MVKVVALKDFISPVHGNVSGGDVFNISNEIVAQNMEAAGLLKTIRKEGEPAPEPEELGMDDIKQKLKDEGVEFHPRTGKAKLLEMLKEVKNGQSGEAASA